MFVLALTASLSLVPEDCLAWKNWIPDSHMPLNDSESRRESKIDIVAECIWVGSLGTVSTTPSNSGGFYFRYSAGCEVKI
jgi:hypothetical protein